MMSGSWDGIHKTSFETLTIKMTIMVLILSLGGIHKTSFETLTIKMIITVLILPLGWNSQNVFRNTYDKNDFNSAYTAPGMEFTKHLSKHL